MGCEGHPETPAVTEADQQEALVWFPRHEPTSIATASSQTAASSRRGTFSQAELAAELPVRTCHQPQTSVSRSVGRQSADDLVVAMLDVARVTRE
jgi:hypothetical protein